MPDQEVPDFGALLAPLLGRLEEADRPGLLVGLERAAAARYRAWAEELPRHAEALLACARGEEEIAERAGRLFPIDAAAKARLEAILPEARAVFLGAFAGLALRDQLALQAAAERQGSAAWRTLAAAPGTSAATREALAACSALEEASAARLEAILAR